ncbi:putative fatty acyl-CoA reductase CG5065 [Tachypleus tridentatus]|uniref:putative fatty acyl-CoA reductase CG5065 n=1 Tax=Tachypleus tridentatus TaxID=6853 RepID=UPI003FD02EE2
MEHNDPVGSLSSHPVNSNCDSEIGAFFRNRAVLVTGATGFVGKVLVQKLLYSCSSVKTIYVLLRPKDGREARGRLDELLLSKAFDKVLKEKPSAITKIVPITGDVTENGLGINFSDEALLLNNVSVVFHCAATVRFDDSFKVSVNINVVGTKRVLELCHKMKHLTALIHVSSAYCNCNLQQIDEVVYTESVSPKKIIDATEWMSESSLDSLFIPLLQGRPSVYHYTKALAENVLVDDARGLPVAVIRPSIITASWKEPVPGWVDNLNGPSGFIVATGKGILRTMMVNPGVAADVIPVDIVVNLMICAAWQLEIQRPVSVMVYNCTSSSIKKITWSEIEKLARPFILMYPSMEVFRYPGGSFKTNRFLNRLCEVVNHELPAKVVDFLAELLGHKTGLVQVYKRVHRAVHILEYFTTHEWTFQANNMLTLMRKLKGLDKKVFDLDMCQIDLCDYMKNYVLGVRRFVLKEDDSTLAEARRKLRVLYYIEFIFQVLLLSGIIPSLIVLSKLTRRFWWSFMLFVVQLYPAIVSKVLGS